MKLERKDREKVSQIIQKVVDDDNSTLNFDWKQKDDKGRTQLHRLVTLGDSKMTRALLEKTREVVSQEELQQFLNCFDAGTKDFISGL